MVLARTLPNLLPSFLSLISQSHPPHYTPVIEETEDPDSASSKDDDDSVGIAAIMTRQ